MSDQIIHPNNFSELRSKYKYYIDSYNALYQLKTENEEELNSIYKMIKTQLIDSKKHLPRNVIRAILNIIPYNNRYTKPYLTLAKLIYDDYHIKEVNNIEPIPNFLFCKEYNINLDKSQYFTAIHSENLDIHTENTIYRAIIFNDLERFITFTQRDGFDKEHQLISSLYPLSFAGCTLLELCCYHGAVDCFKFLRTEFNSGITLTCLHFSFLGGNPDIMSECLKYQTPNFKCMEYAIISHNIDFVTFLMNEYKIDIDLSVCGLYNNLESFLVYFDQTNYVNSCFLYSSIFNIKSLCKYFILQGVYINFKDVIGRTALHIAARFNSKEAVEFLLSQGMDINEKDGNEETALYIAVSNNSKETVDILLSHGANVNEKIKYGNTALHIATHFNYKEMTELLLSHGAKY